MAYYTVLVKIPLRQICIIAISHDDNEDPPIHLTVNIIIKENRLNNSPGTYCEGSAKHGKCKECVLDFVLVWISVDFRESST